MAYAILDEGNVLPSINLEKADMAGELSMTQSTTSGYAVSNGYLTNIPPKTDIATFKSNLQNDPNAITVLGINGNAVTSGYIGTGMTIQYKVNGTVLHRNGCCVERCYRRRKMRCGGFKYGYECLRRARLCFQ